MMSKSRKSSEDKETIQKISEKLKSENNLKIMQGVQKNQLVTADRRNPMPLK